MEIGKMYNIAYCLKYDINYETNVKCIKITKKSYKIERPDGTIKLIDQESIIELKEV